MIDRASHAGIGVIAPDALYTKEAFSAATGLGIGALRQCRRQGLPVSYVGGRMFVRGSDFIAYVEQVGKRTKDE